MRRAVARALCLGGLAVSCGRRPPPSPEPAIAAPAIHPQRIVDVHLGSPAGPVVARVYPGAEVAVAPAGDGQVLVTVAPYEFKGYADADAFGAERRAPGEPSRSGRLVKDMPTFELAPTRDTDDAFAWTKCGEIRVVDEGGRARVTQLAGGVEVIGWGPAGGPFDLRRGPSRCGLRVLSRQEDGRWMLTQGKIEGDAREVQSAPDGFVHLDAAAKDELAPLLASGGKVWWLTQSSANTAVCIEWSFGRRHEEGFGLLTRARGVRFGDAPAFASFTTRYEPESREVTLLGPHFSSRPLTNPSVVGDLGGYRCGRSYGFVGTRERALRMFPGGRPSLPILAWHPDDEELWYTRAEDCEVAAAAATAALAGDPESTPPGGLHVDCFPELEP
jgi:hypothetical protein